VKRILDEKRKLILAAAKKYGKTCSMLVSDAKQAREWKQAGALLLAHSTDAEILCGAFRQAMKSIKGSP